MKIVLATARVLAALALPALPLAPQAAAPETPAAIFKGPWAGPSVMKLPGKGPAPGQSIEDYFLNLETGPRSPSVRRVLVLGGARKFQHDSISTAMAGVHRWGQDNGLWEAELRTDFTLVSPAGGGPMNAGFQPKGLGDFDAVVVASADGDWQLSPVQKKALLDFVRAGKGLVVMHGGLDANHDWPDYIDMVGAEQVGHPFNTLEQPVYPFPLVTENTAFPATAFFPARFVKQDELYTVRNWSRQDVDVLLRIDESAVPVAGKGDELPPDHDMPVAWIKSYGKGRVFASTLGHTREAYRDPEIVRMYTEAIKWALGLSGGPFPRPHPRK
ncbi:ThuA domain-containing protein [Massilia niastensis]|uniref:ThuA domain-containing protein n=1 Tax=Massilia niastensis TaxID=544911 RepID=UPI000368DF01|nr:ThuA domain-containing protein [Massilia niastensis]